MLNYESAGPGSITVLVVATHATCTQLFIISFRLVDECVPGKSWSRQNLVTRMSHLPCNGFFLAKGWGAEVVELSTDASSKYSIYSNFTLYLHKGWQRNCFIKLSKLFTNRLKKGKYSKTKENAGIILMHNSGDSTCQLLPYRRTMSYLQIVHKSIHEQNFIHISNN